MTVKRMDNVGIVVEDLDAAIEFFSELGLELEGRTPIQGDWADGVTGLRDMQVEIVMMRTPDRHSRLEMSRFLAPPVVADHRTAPVNALGYLRVMFTVENIDDTLARLRKKGAQPRMRALQQVAAEHGVTHMAAMCAICKAQFSKVLPMYGFEMDAIVSIHQMVSNAIILDNVGDGSAVGEGDEE